MRIRILVFFLGAVFISIQLKAQQFSLRHYTAVDGLPQSQVNAIVEDENGYLWIGTQGGGLARFDGKEFKTYNTLDGLLSNIISSLMIDNQQNVWVVHPHGISKFDGVSFKTFQSPVPNPKRIRRIYALGDSVLFTMQAGTLGKIYRDSVYYWDRAIAPGKTIFSSSRLPDRHLYFYLNDSSFLILTPNGQREAISHKNVFNRVHGLFHWKGNMVIESDKGYYSLDAANKTFQREAITSQKHIVAYDTLNKFLWAFTDNVLSHEMEDGSNPVEVLKNVMVTQIHFDREGSAWIGTNGRGLYKYATQDFDRCASENLTSVMAINQDRTGAVWIGSGDKGLWRIHHGKIKNYTFNKEEEVAINDIKISPSGELWIASNYGLGRYDSIRDTFNFLNRENGLSSQYIVNIEFDQAGNIWCGTVGAGLNYYDGQHFKQVNSEKGLKGQIVYALRYFNGNNTLFVGSEFGLNKIHDQEVTYVAIPELRNTSVYSINTYLDSHLLIGSSGGGVIVFDPVANRVKNTLTTHEGLPSNLIYFVAADQDDHIWIGTEQGINRVKLNADFEIEENLHYGYENGLTGVETNQNAYFLGDEKYFGLIDGIYQYNRNQNIPTRSHDLHLTAVDLFYGEFPVQDYADSTIGFFKVPYNPTFSAGKNHLTFYFNRVDKRNPKSIRYKYYLKNFDKAWSQPTTLGQVTYGNLPPGDYSLQVLATNKQGSWDTVPLVYSFTIQAPFYASVTFISVMGILIVGLALLVMSIRVRSKTRRVLEIEHIRQQEQEQLRKEIARDFHDEMGNQLTRIINYISLMKLSRNGQTADLYNKVEESAKYLYAGTRDFIWSIDPLNDELSRLFLHIRDFGEKLFEEKEINFRAYNEIKESLRLPYGFSREANLILKEAMTNVFNHACAQNVSFILRSNGDQLEMVLEDDGKGFSMAEISHLNGIKNMRLRAERIKAVLRIQSIHPGTRVTLAFVKLKSKKYVSTL